MSDLPQNVREHIDAISKAEKTLLDLIRDSNIESDGRWKSIAITDIEKGVMSARRAFAEANKRS